MEVVGVVLIVNKQEPRFGIPQRAHKLLVVGSIGMYQAVIEAIVEYAIALLWTMIVKADVGTEFPAPDDSIDKVALQERNTDVVERISV